MKKQMAGLLGMVWAVSAAASEGVWGGDHWGVFVAHTSSQTRLSTFSPYVEPGYEPAVGTFFLQSDIPVLAEAGRGRVTAGGQSLGLTWGRQWQTGQRVSGFEFDLGRLGLAGSRSASALYPCCAPTGFQVVQSIDVDWVATARGRLGHAFNRSMVYATAGVVLAQLRVDARFIDNYEDARASTQTSTTRWGWAVGAGFEHALANGWSLKAEVMHFELGRVSGASNNLVSGFGVYQAAPFTTRARLRANQLRLGLNKRW